MGSRARHSSGRKAASFRARKGRCKTSRPEPAPKSEPDLHVILGRLSDAMSIIATATRSMAAAEQIAGSATAADVGEEIITLEHGMRVLRSAYDEMDVALRAVTP